MAKSKTHSEYKVGDEVVHKQNASNRDSSAKETHAEVVEVIEGDNGSVSYTVKNWRSKKEKEIPETSIVGRYVANDA